MIESYQSSVHLKGGENLEDGVSINLPLVGEKPAPIAGLEYPPDLLFKSQLRKKRLVHHAGLTKPLRSQASQPLLEVNLLKCWDRGY